MYGELQLFNDVMLEHAYSKVIDGLTSNVARMVRWLRPKALSVEPFTFQIWHGRVLSISWELDRWMRVFVHESLGGRMPHIPPLSWSELYLLYERGLILPSQTSVTKVLIGLGGWTLHWKHKWLAWVILKSNPL